MGSYHDIVCPEHKAVLRLWKVDELWSELNGLIDEGKTTEESAEPFGRHFIVISPSIFKTVIEFVPTDTTKQ